MSAERRHVAVDLGASGGRVALGTINDGRLEVEILHRFWNGPVAMQGGLYWDHVGLWREILAGLRMAGERGEIESVGVNSWGVDYALLDEYDHVIDGVRHYRDARTEGIMDRVFESLATGKAKPVAEPDRFADAGTPDATGKAKPVAEPNRFADAGTPDATGKAKPVAEPHRFAASEEPDARGKAKPVAEPHRFASGNPRDRIYDATGIQFMELNTLFQLYAQKEQTPAHLAQARSALMFPDLLHFWLSGKKVAEVTIASTTQMLDPQKRAWHKELMAELGLPTNLFPPPIEPGTVLGPVLDSIGLKGAKVILPAAHDTGSAVAAVPAEGKEGWAYISSGTWSLVGVESPKPVITEETATQNLTNEAGINGTTRLLKNVMGLWILQECRRAWGDPDFTALYQEAEALPAGGPTVDPDDVRFLRPCEDMAALVRQVCQEQGQSAPQSRGEVTRCILDSLAKRSAEVLDGLERATGQKIHTVHIVGGGSQIEFLNRLIANASGRTVVAGPIEATLMGNILIQAEAAGSIPQGSIRETVRRSVSLRTYAPKAGG